MLRFIIWVHSFITVSPFPHIQEERALFQNVTAGDILLGNSGGSLLLMFPLPFAKLCTIDERIRGQNLFNRLGEEKTETVPVV
jgi:hypothetical protein